MKRSMSYLVILYLSFYLRSTDVIDSTSTDMNENVRDVFLCVIFELLIR